MKKIFFIGGLIATINCVPFTQTKEESSNKLKNALNYCNQLCKKNVSNFFYEEFKDGNTISTKCDCVKINKN